MENNGQICYWVYIICANENEALAIGKQLVEEKLAACTNILPGHQSFYWWNGQVESSSETSIIAKTNDAKLALLIERAKSLHSYDVPCIIAGVIEQGYSPYLAWIHSSLN
jgi:periplasmic divalent cation tolerance protein